MSKVLIATSDSLAFDALAAEVAGEGYDVVWARDGKEAYDEILVQAPDLVFLEEGLAVFDGFEVADMVRGDPDVPKTLPILLLTDHACDPRRMERSGFTGHFPKTHGYFELRERIVALIDAETTAP